MAAEKPFTSNQKIENVFFLDNLIFHVIISFGDYFEMERT